MTTGSAREDAAGLAVPAAMPARPAGATGAFRSACFGAILLMIACGLGAAMLGPNSQYAEGLVFLTLFGAMRQDVPVAIGMGVFIGIFATSGGARLLGRPLRVPDRARHVRMILGGIVAMAATAWAIRIALLFDHDLSRDEQMASFDAMIFGAGRLYWPVAPEMQDLVGPLNSLFFLPLGGQGLVSAYLPVNAAIRALLATVLPGSAIAPLLLAIAGFALWRVAARIWPDERGVQAVVMLCFAGSSQAILTAASTFAMTAHLTLNLVWLALFLRGTRAGFAGSVVAGFLATGLHQPLFHPLFVLPFLDLLRRQRRWRELALYCLCYAAIGLFWLAWPQWLASLVPSPLPDALAQRAGFLDRLVHVIVVPDLDAVWIMAGNALRFIAWQHLLLVPLLLVAARKVAATDDLARALLLGIVLLFAAMFILLPPQGHGWGYRYAHGLIGSSCLLAGYGWRWLRDNGGAPVLAMKAATALSLIVLLPLHAKFVRDFVQPFAEGLAAFARVPADYIVVENDLLPYGTNLVINRPDLSNRPLLLLGSQLEPASLARLCPGSSIAFADAYQFNDIRVYYLDPPLTGTQPHQRALREAAVQAGCRVVPFSR